MNAKSGMKQVHPDEILRDEFDELRLSANALSNALGVSVNRVTMILNGQRGVSADTTLRLARFLGTTPQPWLNLQKTWELSQAEIAGSNEIAKCVTPRQSAVAGSGADAHSWFSFADTPCRPDVRWRWGATAYRVLERIAAAEGLSARNVREMLLSVRQTVDGFALWAAGRAQT